MLVCEYNFANVNCIKGKDSKCNFLCLAERLAAVNFAQLQSDLDTEDEEKMKWTNERRKKNRINVSHSEKSF